MAYLATAGSTFEPSRAEQHRTEIAPLAPLLPPVPPPSWWLGERCRCRCCYWPDDVDPLYPAQPWPPVEDR